MKRNVALLLLSTLALAAASPQDEQSLRLKIADGQVDRYRIEIASTMKMDAPGVGPQDFGLTGSMDSVYTFGAKDDQGKHAVEMKTSNIKLEATGAAEMMMGGQELPKEYTIKAKVDDRYRVSDAKTEGLSAQTQMMMGMGGAGSVSMLFELPEKPVKIGDTWQVLLPKSPGTGNKDYPLTAKLVGVKEVDGTAAYEVEVTGKVDLDVNMSEVFKKMSEAGAANPLEALGDMILKGTLDVTGTAMIAKEDGHLLRSESKMASKQNLSIGGALSVDINGTTTVKMNRTKG